MIVLSRMWKEFEGKYEFDYGKKIVKQYTNLCLETSKQIDQEWMSHCIGHFKDTFL